MSDRPKDYAMVTTISTVKTVYMVPLEEIAATAPEGVELTDEYYLDWIKDSVTCEEVRDAGQQFLGENIMDSHLISETRALQIMDTHNGGISSWTKEQKLDYLKTWKEPYTWAQKEKKDIAL